MFTWQKNAMHSDGHRRFNETDLSHLLNELCACSSMEMYQST